MVGGGILYLGDQGDPISRSWAIPYIGRVPSSIGRRVDQDVTYQMKVSDAGKGLMLSQEIYFPQGNPEYHKASLSMGLASDLLSGFFSERPALLEIETGQELFLDPTTFNLPFSATNIQMASEAQYPIKIRT
ncbi:MAG: hypothetical protein JW727_06040 [Candidatus Aenigmarchaeota archaeon]|nr:hypothetical protein [Candidatus Aenigmarchaeota archaeon]